MRYICTIAFINRSIPDQFYEKGGDVGDKKANTYVIYGKNNTNQKNRRPSFKSKK